MSLVSKIAAVAISAFVAFLLIQLLSHQLLVNKNLETLETAFSLRELEHSQQFLNSQLNQLETTTVDWSIWDENYDFMRGENNDFVRSNIHSPSLEALKAHGIILLKPDKTLKAGIMSDARYSITPHLLNEFVQQHGHIIDLVEDINYSKTGMLVFNEKIYFVSVHSILRGDYSGPSAGWLIMFRLATPKLFESRQSTLNTKTTISTLAFFTNHSQESLSQESIIIEKQPNKLVASKYLTDIYGKLNIALSTEMPREFINQSQSTFNQVLYNQLITAAIIGLISFLYLRRWISLPLSRLINTFENTASLEDVHIPKEKTRKDEIGRLTNILREAIEKLRQSLNYEHEIQQRSMKQNKLLFELANDKDLNEGHLHQSFYKILASLVTNTESERSSIWLLNQDLDTAQCYACYSKSGDNVETNTKVSTNVLTQSLLKKLIKQRTFITDLDTNRTKELLGIDVYDNAVICPIIVGKQVQGALISEFKPENKSDISGNELFLASVSELCSNSIYANERKQLQEQLSHMAHHDSLTGIPNRSFFNVLLEKSIARAKRESRGFSLLYIDLDKFKPVNDRFGHSTGDQLLIQVTKRIIERLRESDTLARIGGDEFLVLLDDTDNRPDAELVATELIAVINRPFEINNQVIRIGCSIGISLYPEHGNDIDQLIISADHAMYQVKKSGRGALAVAEQPKFSSNSS
ncbi:sensor domain-containing diguanylate cyclase [Litoribacillus peritrichatus]|uniref:Diguanylate cyclase n=1 Tax=Litoribacillus peritrichatus TaxID=718191 RepID=A0ABP7M3W8_9GAMM